MVHPFFVVFRLWEGENRFSMKVAGCGLRGVLKPSGFSFLFCTNKKKTETKKKIAGWQLRS